MPCCSFTNKYETWFNIYANIFLLYSHFLQHSMGDGCFWIKYFIISTINKTFWRTFKEICHFHKILVYHQEKWFSNCLITSSKMSFFGVALYRRGFKNILVRKTSSKVKTKENVLILKLFSTILDVECEIDMIPDPIINRKPQNYELTSTRDGIIIAVVMMDLSHQKWLLASSQASYTLTPSDPRLFPKILWNSSYWEEGVLLISYGENFLLCMFY